MCSRGCPLSLRHRGSGKCQVRLSDCGSLACSECGPRVRERWLDHLSKQFGPLVCVIAVPKADWLSWYRILNDSGFDYAAIHTGDSITVFSAIPMAFNECGCSQVPTDEAYRRARDAIMRARPTKRLVTTSRGWKLPKRSASSYELLSRKASIPAVAKAAEELSVPVVLGENGRLTFDGSKMSAKQLAALIGIAEHLTVVERLPKRTVPYGISQDRSCLALDDANLQLLMSG